MSPFDALERALQLRARGLSYPAIAAAMDVCHGVRKAPDTWRELLRANGAPVRRSDLAGRRPGHPRLHAAQTG